MNNIVVFVSGYFNILHPGHLRLLRSAKELGNKLIVGVISDNISGNAAHLPENLRLEALKSLNLVDEAFIANESIANIINKLKPDIVVKGKEHELTENQELSILQEYGGKLIFTSGESMFSSIDLIRNEFSDQDLSNVKFPVEFLKRHNINRENLISIIERFKDLKICVVGDLIIDEYITCDALGMSQEDPTIVVTPVNKKKFLGGAGIVAAHASTLGSSVNFFSVSGLDEARTFALNELSKHNIINFLIPDKSRPTTLKQRYRCKGKSLLRVSYLHQETISIELQNKIKYSIFSKLDNCDLLVFSDFNYGCLPQALVDEIIKYAKQKKNIIIAADSQSSSQLGNISRFNSLDLITPTEREARISTRNKEDGLIVLAEKLRTQSSAKNILLKLGEEGLLIHACHINDNSHITDRLEALNKYAKDPAGAGDSLLISSAMTLACGGNIWEAALIGSLTASIQVSRLGNIPITSSELLEKINY